MTEPAVTSAYSFVSSVNKDRSGDIVKRLQTSNQAHVPDDEAKPVEIYVLNGAERVVAGLVARVIWGWFEIVAIWVDEDLRGRGLGTELMGRGETEAREKGATAARFSTWDFQALGFYERLGYTQYGRLDNYPPGHTVYYLHKKLSG